MGLHFLVRDIDNYQTNKHLYFLQKVYAYFRTTNDGPNGFSSDLILVINSSYISDGDHQDYTYETNGVVPSIYL